MRTTQTALFLEPNLTINLRPPSWSLCNSIDFHSLPQQNLMPSGGLENRKRKEPSHHKHLMHAKAMLQSVHTGPIGPPHPQLVVRHACARMP